MDDRRITLRGPFHALLETAAARRHLSTAAFVTFVVGEYLRECGELPTATPNNVSPTVVSAEPDMSVWFDEDD